MGYFVRQSIKIPLENFVEVFSIIPSVINLAETFQLLISQKTQKFIFQKVLIRSGMRCIGQCVFDDLCCEPDVWYCKRGPLHIILHVFGFHTGRGGQMSLSKWIHTNQTM